jgi:uncharacterized protein involved in exopolysaccharide biosynthesis
MEMELIDVLQVLRRRLGLIVAIVLVTVAALGLRLRLSEPVYRARVTLQLTTPQAEDVAAFDQYTYVSQRDEVTVARNNFVEVLKSDEVRDRTINALSLGARDATYGLEVELVSDSDFIYVSVNAGTPELAVEIANTHVGLAVQNYGELRAKPTDAEKGLFGEQSREAEEELRAAEDALAKFKAQNGVASLEDGLATYQKLLEQLELERDKRLMEATSPSDNAGQSGNSLNPTAEVDKLIAQRQAELAHLVALGPAYKLLEDNIVQARAKYQHMQDKYNEAAIKERAVRAANFIQVIAPANPPSGPVSNIKWIALALAGSLGCSVLLAFFLDYVSRPGKPAPEPTSVMLPDRLLETLRESQRAAYAMVVSPSSSSHASASAGLAPRLDDPEASEK